MSDERTFVDTTILVHAVDRSAGTKHDVAKHLLERLWSTQQGCVSIQVLQEFYASVERLRHDMTGDAQRLVSDYATWTVHAPDALDVMAAIDTHQRQDIPFWDAMILQSAHRLDCTTVLTERLSHGRRIGDAIIVNPFP